ncbi:response regulator [Maricaulis maris]|uniref:Response regulator receiver domain-containing protein n=1 Tax=Maricaulis maris TaxID=74318 RepID=A0A495DJC6_9PROT|nr:response regulator [Maricaulis maris]RKR02723.1 response regulator receiver domain-containing protein [Maricaulis maris]
MAKILKRILLLEDIEANANLIRFSLETVSDFEVTHATNGREAIECFTSNAFDICLFDHLMPGMTGLDAMRAIRRLPNGTGVPFVFLTARSDVGNWKQLKENGAQAVISKPFDIMLLGAQLIDVFHAYQHPCAERGEETGAAPAWAATPSRSALAHRPSLAYRRF